jgi:hypothetical protein
MSLRAFRVLGVIKEVQAAESFLDHFFRESRLNVNASYHAGTSAR